MVLRAPRPIYRQPYPPSREFPFPRGYKIPDFTLFSGEDGRSTVEHIARLTLQCTDTASNDFIKLRQFLNSLTGSALGWYLRLPPNSILTWQELEEHQQFDFIGLSPKWRWLTCLRLSRCLTKPLNSTSVGFKGIETDVKLTCQSGHFLMSLRMAVYVGAWN